MNSPDDLPPVQSHVAQPPALETTTPTCTFITGPRGSGKTLWILQKLRPPQNASTLASSPDKAVAVMLAEEGRTRAESLTAAYPGLTLRRLVLPCHCCPELARLPSAARALHDANPALQHLYIEVPDVTALRFIEEFNATVGWPRKLVLCITPAWIKARRLGMLSPFQIALFAAADEIIEREPASAFINSIAGNSTGKHTDTSQTAAPFQMTLQ